MAKKRNGSQSNQATPDVQPPEGFGLNVGRERGEGWVKKEAGNEVCGRLVGRHTYRDKASGKTRAYYQVKLLRPCTVEIVDPDAAEGDEDPQRISTKMDPGHIVNIDETKRLEDLEEYTKNGGTYDLWFVYGEKIDIGGREMWSMTGPKLRVVRAPAQTPDQDIETPFS